jgi:heavy metal sensor kinase
MLESVRVRLTLWYTSALALVLVALSLATYFILRRSTAHRADGNIAEISEAFLTTLQAEMKDEEGANEVKDAAQEAMIEHRFRDQIYVIFDSRGQLLLTSSDSPFTNSSPGLKTDEILASDSFRSLVNAASHESRVFQNVAGHRGGYRGYARHFQVKGDLYLLVVLQSRHSQQEMLEEIATTFEWAIPISLLLASAGGYFLARKSLAPVVGMSTQAGRISAANLHERLPVQNAKDELGHLASSFNSLLDRLDESFERQRRFMADASHELRTPVAILRGEADVALSREERPAEEYRESLTVLRDESQRLTHIVEDLFTLTRADAGQYPLTRRDFYLEELVADCARTTRALALAKKVSIHCSMAEELPIHADEGLLRRMVLNLLDNAIKYTPEGGKISIECRRAGNEYAVSVTDTGTGIPLDLQPRIFERFFRVDKARSRSDGDTVGTGAGLGLSIARWIAEAHEGRLELVRSDASGSTFTVFLRASASNSSDSVR